MPGASQLANWHAGTRVIVCSAQPLLRAGLRATLTAQPDISVVAEVPSAGDVAGALRRQPAQVLVIDAQADVQPAAMTVRQLRAAVDCPVQAVAITALDCDGAAILELLHAGARALLLRDDPGYQVVEAVRAVAAGYALLTPAIMGMLLDRKLLPSTPASLPPAAALAGLTRREREVLELVSQGLCNAEIAKRLVVAERTVKFHVSNVLAKLGLRDRVQAAVLAARTVT